jgi:hypothetical protein
MCIIPQTGSRLDRDPGQFAPPFTDAEKRHPLEQVLDQLPATTSAE